MKYTFETDKRKRITTVRVFGDVFINEASSLGAEARLRAKREHNRLIIDFRQARSHITVLDTDYWYWIDQHCDSIDSHLKDVPTIHLINDEDEDFFSFVEAMFKDREDNTSIFKDEDAAVCWLVSQPV
jgi:hypothetical protein